MDIQFCIRLIGKCSCLNSDKKEEGTKKLCYQGEVLGASHSIVVASSIHHTIGGPHLFLSPRSLKIKRYLEEFGWGVGRD